MKKEREREREKKGKRVVQGGGQGWRVFNRRNKTSRTRSTHRKKNSFAWPAVKRSRARLLRSTRLSIYVYILVLREISIIRVLTYTCTRTVVARQCIHIEVYTLFFKVYIRVRARESVEPPRNRDDGYGMMPWEDLKNGRTLRPTF